MAEAYFDNKLRDANVNVRRNPKTVEAFGRLPDVFTMDDVIRCFSLNNSNAARAKVFRLQKDNFVEQSETFVENGTTKNKYKKTGLIML